MNPNWINTHKNDIYNIINLTLLFGPQQTAKKVED